MSQFDFGNLSSPLSGSSFIDSKLEPWRNALHSMHKGNTRPSYATPGMLWVDDSTNPWQLKMFMGAVDSVVGYANTDGTFTIGAIAAAMLSFIGSASLADARTTLDVYSKSELTTALNAKAPLASPSFTGTPSAPNASAGTDTQQLATTHFVKQALDNFISPSRINLVSYLLPGTFSFTAPTAITTVYITGAGGGGGGGGSHRGYSGAPTYYGGGGGSSGCGVFRFAVTVTPGASYTIEIGTGGIGGTVGAFNATGRAGDGTNGGQTAFGNSLILPGGYAGLGAVGINGFGYSLSPGKGGAAVGEGSAAGLSGTCCGSGIYSAGGQGGAGILAPLGPRIGSSISGFGGGGTGGASFAFDSNGNAIVSYSDGAAGSNGFMFIEW